MRVRVIFRLGTRCDTGSFLFDDIFIRRRSVWFAQLVSATAHGLLLALIPAIAHAPFGSKRAQIAPATYKLEMIRLDLPNRFSFNAAVPGGNQPGVTEEPAPHRDARQAIQSTQLASPLPATLAKQFVLPVPRRISGDAPIILPPGPTVPSASLITELHARPPELDGHPVPGLQNAPPSVSSVGAVMTALPSPTLPKLLLASPSTVAVRIPDRSGETVVSFEIPLSGLLDLISLMADPPVMASGTAGSPGSVSGSGMPDSSERTVTGIAAAGAAHAAGRAATFAPDTRFSQVALFNLPIRQPPAPPAILAQLPPAPHKSDDGDRGGSRGAAVIRTTNPSNGNFDVVILQSASRDESAADAGILSGNPVYTVYLSVGDVREWVLEYCIPGAANPAVSGYFVNIDDPGPVSAPYPLSTVIPAALRELPRARNIVLHAVLSTDGIFKDVKAPHEEEPFVRDVLALLSQWRFRPALRDQVPVEVEILLIVPATTHAASDPSGPMRGELPASVTGKRLE